eukprot:scaffold543805_cov43-Prasinocladus_malaysianus.AAC.1
MDMCDGQCHCVGITIIFSISSSSRRDDSPGGTKPNVGPTQYKSFPCILGLARPASSNRRSGGSWL